MLVRRLDGLVPGRGVALLTRFVVVRGADASVEPLTTSRAVLRWGRRRRCRGSPGPLLGPLLEVIVPHVRSLVARDRGTDVDFHRFLVCYMPLASSAAAVSFDRLKLQRWRSVIYRSHMTAWMP